MKISEFKGSFFEIGKQQGAIYKKNGMSFNTVKIDPVLYKNQHAVYKKHYPQLLDEFKGMAQGGNFDEEKLIYYFITGEIFYFKNEFRLDKACTIFGYKKGNNVYVGRNYDWLPETENIFEVYKAMNPEVNSFIAVTDMGISNPATAKPKYFFYNTDDAINSKGLFIGLTFAYLDQWSYGISCIHMTKLIAENCETVKEALEVFKKTPLCCPKNFFIADKNGDMVVVEHAAKKFKILYPKENILIQTNHYVDEELAKKDIVFKQVPFHNTCIRYYETLQKIQFEKRTFSRESISKILNRKGSYTCQNFPGIKTIWTLALDMTSKKYKIYWDLSRSKKSKELSI
ncbi:MAG: putative choloylglycine hydrolase [Parcubacteria group bacterium GW2011_GWC1_41_7]|nr:MAG: putative choloylglycine hydrolase [Parcubacteria group bacterium GW2011_GWC1_41_7]